ncbi:hypothetical protein F2P81_018553 [Scophthalmus maximus]|uniref:Uncharacterized protein n=1 Tax=Scophthalmus maximus TaxID=52904 RepID=A0A6A4SB04_SCOMX|nr:hypothetical protein F2P81_018553 [Scophthalmus maximus]
MAADAAAIKKCSVQSEQSEPSSPSGLVMPLLRFSPHRSTNQIMIKLYSHLDFKIFILYSQKPQTLARPNIWSSCGRLSSKLVRDTLAVRGIKLLPLQLQPTPHVGPQRRHSNPSGCGCSGSAALPLPELIHTSVTKPPDWRTVIWTRNEGDETRGQTKLAHQRGKSTLQAISCSSLR